MGNGMEAETGQCKHSLGFPNFRSISLKNFLSANEYGNKKFHSLCLWHKFRNNFELLFKIIFFAKIFELSFNFLQNLNLIS